MTLINLKEKYVTYIGQLPKVQDEFGFIDSDHCDSLLFSSLIGCVNGVNVDIEAAFNKESKTWHRRPTNNPCFPKHSRSTISRDMFTGLAWYCYVHQRMDIAEQVVKYALSHAGIMGKADSLSTLIGRCFIGPGLLATFAKISGKYKWLHWIPADVLFGKLPTDYESHLQVLHRLLRHKIDKTDHTKDKVLQKQFKRQHQNPLFAIAAGKNNAAIAWLLDSRLWPTNRLPTSKDRQEGWLLQRDYGTDWQPDGVKKTHSGGDFLFCYALLDGQF